MCAWLLSSNVSNTPTRMIMNMIYVSLHLNKVPNSLEKVLVGGLDPCLFLEAKGELRA